MNTSSPYTDKKCTICGSTANLWAELPRATLLRCERCNHCFTDLDSIKIHETYGSEYYQSTHKNWFENPNYPLFSMLANQIKRSGAISILDIGCGNGAFLKYLANSTSELSLTGIDLSDEAKSNSKIAFVQGDFLKYNFQEKFDFIVTLAVIEHLDNVLSFTKRIHDLLNENGIACVMTLNESGILYKMAELLRKFGSKSTFIRLYDPHHLNHFSKASLINLLTKDGLFELVKIVDHNAPLAAIDVPFTNPILKFAAKMGVAAIFLGGKISKKAYLQTIIVKKSSA